LFFVNYENQYGLPVLMIKRPLSSPPPLYDTPDLLLAAL
jgi:hypothetical protein